MALKWFRRGWGGGGRGRGEDDFSLFFEDVRQEQGREKDEREKDSTESKMRERTRGGNPEAKAKAKAEERKSRFSFLSSGFLCFPRGGRAPRVFSLFHGDAPSLRLLGKSPFCSMSLQISPELATRLPPSPSTKEITLDGASCRCGRGKMRRKEDAFKNTTSTRTIFLLRRRTEKTKSLTCALVAEQSRTSPASSGIAATLDRVCMAERPKKGSKGRKRR